MNRVARILTLSLCLAVLTIVVVASPSWAAREAYLVVTGATQGVIQGDSTAKVAPNAIVVQAIGLGLSIPITTIPGGGSSTGRPNVEPLKIAKFPDKASPKLLLAALTGELLKVDLTWFGADLAFPVFTYIFRETQWGLFQAHCYPFDESRSTMVLLISEGTWLRAGLNELDEEGSLQLQLINWNWRIYMVCPSIV